MGKFSIKNAWPATKSAGKAIGRSRNMTGTVMLGAGVVGGMAYNGLHNKLVKSLSPGTVGYGKRGIDGNNLNTDGLVQGMSNKRRAR